MKWVSPPPIPTIGLGADAIEPLRQQVHRIIGETYARIRTEV